VDYFIVIGSTIFSCFIYLKIGIYNSLNKLIKSYKENLIILTKKRGVKDVQKQILFNSFYQFKTLIFLICQIITLLSPFFLIYVISSYINFNFNIFYSLEGILISIISVLIFFLIKKNGKL